MSDGTDDVRLLHVRSQYGYTSRVSEAMSSEPEAVDRQTQSELTRRAHAAQRARLRATWQETRDGIVGAVQHFRDSGLCDARTASDLRVVERVTRRVDERVGGI